MRAEVTTRSREEANGLLKRYGRKEEKIAAFLPRRMKYRRGIIFEWEDSVEELKEEATPGQGNFVLERMKKRRIVDGKVVFEPMRAIMIVFRGSVLPTRLLIGQGHVGIKIEPYVEPVKQCYRCLRFGHVQATCREQIRKCANCGEKEHGQCGKDSKCVNCGGSHGSLSRGCWVWQREAAIRKVMAFRNVEFDTARGIVARSLGGREMDRLGGLDVDEGMGSREYPALRQRERREVWEEKEVPIERELEGVRRGREENDRNRGINRGREKFSEIVKRKGREEERKAIPAGMEKNNEEAEEEEAATGWSQVRRGAGVAKGGRPTCYNSRTDLFLTNNRYICLECKEKTERNAKVLQKIPFPYELAGKEADKGEKENNDKEGMDEKAAREEERRRREVERKKKEKLEERQREEEEKIMKELIEFLQGKNMEGRFEEILKASRGKSPRTRSPESKKSEEEDWNAVVTPPYLMYVDPKTRERVRVRAERRNREAELRRRREGISTECSLWLEKQRADKEEMERVWNLKKNEEEIPRSQGGEREDVNEEGSKKQEETAKKKGGEDKGGENGRVLRGKGGRGRSQGEMVRVKRRINKSERKKEDRNRGIVMERRSGIRVAGSGVKVKGNSLVSKTVRLVIRRDSMGMMEVKQIDNKTTQTVRTLTDRYKNENGVQSLDHKNNARLFGQDRRLEDWRYQRDWGKKGRKMGVQLVCKFLWGGRVEALDNPISSVRGREGGEENERAFGEIGER
nr:PREDICTED: glutamic acid-rich protein-like [Megachile rotundata]